MKIQVASDLHLEFLGRQDYDDLMSEFPGDADVLILAGDIVPLKYVDQIRNVFGPLCERYGEVVFVPGNHEYYGNNVRDAHLVLGAVENELYNFRVLKNSMVEIKGQKFYGGTLWFPELPKGREYLKQQLNDFYEIQGIEPFCYSNYLEFKRQAVKHLDKNCVVVSHHLPCEESIAMRYWASPLNVFFLGDCDDLLKAFHPKLWIHGHTHESCDYNYYGTRVVCNPFGYNGWNDKYIPRLYIDV